MSWWAYLWLVLLTLWVLLHQLHITSLRGITAEFARYLLAQREGVPRDPKRR